MELPWWGWCLWGFLLYFGYYLARSLIQVASFNIHEFKEKRR